MFKFFINRPIVAMVIAILTVIGGLVALWILPLAQFPQILPTQIFIRTTYTGADAISVEQSVATPLEQSMNGVENMLYMVSTNANDGSLQEVVTFNVDSDPNIDQVNVQNRLAQAQPNFPTDVNKYGLSFRKSTGFPLMIIPLFSPNHTRRSLFLANYANINIIDTLYRVKGVGEVVIFGAGNYSMRIWVKPQVLAKLGLTVGDVINSVAQQNTVNPVGQLGTQPAPKGIEKTYTLRAQGTLITPEDFSKIIVRANPDGSLVYLKDVARLELGALSYGQIARYKGQPACNIAVFQTPGANAIEVSNGVKKAMARLKQGFPPDLDYTIGLDTTLPITEGIKEILKTLLAAMILVTLVVSRLRPNWSATLIPIIAIPVSLIGTFAFFPFLHFSVNTLSLFGIVLAIGLVVDDAIVVVEAIQRHIEEGMSPKDASLKAMGEVSGPVIGIALVLSSVFIPVALMQGIQGSLNRQFALTVAIAVLISAFNALSLSPALASILLKPHEKHTGIFARFFEKFNTWFKNITQKY
ncbi:MAG: efflux RND transporter permease subunit, partial [Candidatus Omnitrophica bacterium]|nr:efflux RND transporter permease subunit [Candidatus Omnitrophota bacterium]